MNELKPKCNHPHIIGDNYGETCAVCGEILAGFGYFAQSRICKHKWVNSEYGLICLYCEEFKDNETNEEA